MDRRRGRVVRWSASRIGSRFGRRLRIAVALALVGASVVFTSVATASSALELVRIAHAREAAQEDDVAVRRYMEALAVDPTCSEAYLGLGALRSRQGDLREAERVYNVALEHRPELEAARLARAHVRHALGRGDEAVADLLYGREEEPAALRVLAAWHAESGQVPAQLAVWRRIAAIAEKTQDAALRHEARLTVRALVILVGPADPAAAPSDVSLTRRLLANHARKGD